eukprot:TRINITY_DN40976_c0_g2_i1.p1 TRINITY_DN40976_c0_g2~~TRINITY_DN40976_c0_g2_i1.p1  ORF type:complete len:330 (-),score=48.40 TRINITY_DN40976_c0_g2_i1:230-1219(-)
MAVAYQHGQLPSPIPFSTLVAGSSACHLRWWQQTSNMAVAHLFESIMLTMTERSRDFFLKHRPNNVHGLENAYLRVGGTSREHTIGELIKLHEGLELPLHLVWKAMHYLDTFYMKAAETGPVVCPETLRIAASVVAGKAHRQQGQQPHTDSSVIAVRTLLESSNKPKEAVFELEMQLLETLDFEIASPTLFDILDGMKAYLLVLGGSPCVCEAVEKISARLFVNANLVSTFEPGALAAAAVLLTLRCPQTAPPPATQLLIQSGLRHMLCQSTAESFNRHLIDTCVRVLFGSPSSDGAHHPTVSDLCREVLEMARPTSSVSEDVHTVGGR